MISPSHLGAKFSPGYADQVAEQPTQILRLEAIPTRRGREAEQRPAPPIPAARKEDDTLLEQCQQIPGPLAVHFGRRE